MQCGAPRRAASDRGTAAPVAERKRVWVLFMDLVGFTTASESRDAEDVRELLSGYSEPRRIRTFDLRGYGDCCAGNVDASADGATLAIEFFRGGTSVRDVAHR